MATDWIDRAVKIAGALGFNEVRVRWKLQNWQRRREQGRRRRDQRLEHIRYQHKTCGSCGAVQDRDAKSCSRCGAQLTARRWQVLGRIGLSAPRVASVSALLGVAMTVIYVRLMLAGEGGLFSLDVPTLLSFGGSFPPLIARGEWWRLFTAIFLHAGLWHIGFNLMALSIIGPRVEELYGRLQTLFFFMLTGVVANVGSMFAGLHGVGVGASGAIMGLVGIAAGWGQRQNTSAGRALRNDMIKWSLYVFFFGFLIGADNWAHLFGLLCGAAIGYAIKPELLSKRALRPVTLCTAAIGLLAAAGTIALVLSNPGAG